MGPCRRVGGHGVLPNWGLLVCARGAQQQAAQREKREREGDAENQGLVHAATIARAARGRQGRGRGRLPSAHMT